MHVYEINTLHQDCGAYNGQNFVRSESRQVSLLNLAKGYEQFRRVCFIWRQEIRVLTRPLELAKFGMNGLQELAMLVQWAQANLIMSQRH